MVEMKARVRVPRSVSVGEDIEVKTLVQHPMHNGFHRDDDGKVIPELIIHTFEASFGGETVFKVDMAPGIAVNPYIAFNYRVQAGGDMTFRWEDDEGDVLVETKTLNVG